MNVLAYLITLANLQHISRIGAPLKDTSIHLGTLTEMKEELLSMTDFPIEGYRKNGVQKHGNLAVYPSKSVRNFIFNGQGNPDDEGLIIKLCYGDKSDPDNEFDMLAYLIYKEGQLGEGGDKYFDSEEAKTLLLGRRSKGPFLDKLIS